MNSTNPHMPEIIAYHGSPYDFCYFDITKIDTIAGVQDEFVAQYYQESFSKPRGVKGNLYRVRIKADPECFLDIDKTVGDQSNFVKAVLWQSTMSSSEFPVVKPALGTGFTKS